MIPGFCFAVCGGDAAGRGRPGAGAGLDFATMARSSWAAAPVFRRRHAAAPSPIPRQTVSFAGRLLRPARSTSIPPSGGSISCSPTARRCATASASAATVSAGAASTASPPRRNGRAGPRRRRCWRGGPTCRATCRGGIDNPLGARAMYLGSTLYRIHGSNEPETIGQAVSSGCFRMTNEDVTDLYSRVSVGTTVIVRN